MSLVAWEQALLALEADLDEVESSLASGTELELSAPPTGLGPLPSELRFRAAALHARMGKVEQALASALSRTRQTMALTDRPDPLAEVPRLFDARG